MKKTILALIIFAVIFTTAYSLPWEVQIEGHPVVFEVEPRIIQGQLYVPLYTFYQQLGLSISFDHTRMTVTGGKSGLKIETKIGSDTALINGNPRSLEGVPVIIANRTMVPLNFVAKTFGYNVIVSSDLKVFYLRKFITPYKDIADANKVEAGFNALEGLPPVSLSLKEMEGRKEHYLNAGASWKEIIFISEKKDVHLMKRNMSPAVFILTKNYMVILF
jgi:hypothetical protein